MRKHLKLWAVFKPIIGQFWEDIYLLSYTFEIQYISSSYRKKDKANYDYGGFQIAANFKR